MKKIFKKHFLKRSIALGASAAMAIGAFVTFEAPLDVNAAFEAKHYDITINGGYWNGVRYDLNNSLIVDSFLCDSKYTYFLQADGTPMKDRLTYHPDGEHIIYFDAYGHETFSNFRRVKRSIAGEDVDDLCFFDVYGYMYVNFLTYDQTGTNLYYANPYGVMECSGWFQFAGDAGPVAEAFGITEGTYGYAYPCGIVDPASIGDESKMSTFIPNPDYNYSYTEDLGIDDSELYYTYPSQNGNGGNGNNGGNGGNGGNDNGGNNNGGNGGNGNGDNGNGDNGNGNNGNGVKIASDYTYEIIPLLEPFNQYFYIKTDNPDPDTFRFVDESTKYSDTTGSITPVQKIFADVKYENEETARVKGGYIATGSYTDGGTLKLQEATLTSKTPVYNISTGKTTYSKNYNYNDTNITLEVPALVDNVDYLIQTYTLDKTEFFDKMSAVQRGFSSICLYGGTYVLGEQKKNEGSYYGISTSPHIDQIYYIQDPYYRESSTAMLVGALYPFRYDSLGFPSIMASTAKRIDSSATYAWNSGAHYLVDITYNGETRSYGGAGSGEGQGIEKDMIVDFFSFDGAKGDLYNNYTMESLAAKINYYDSLTIPDNRENILTWASIRSKVGAKGSYVRLALITSIFGGGGTGYTFLYDDGSNTEGTNGWGSVGHFYNAWFEGRYYNAWEFFYPGLTFEDAVDDYKNEGGNLPSGQMPHLYFKDYYCPVPEGYEYTTVFKYSGTSVRSGTKEKVSSVGYNKDTGVWEGYMWFLYDKNTDSWKMNEFESYDHHTIYFDHGLGNYGGEAISDPTFLDRSEITMNEVLNVNDGGEYDIDRNTNKEPSNFLIYDMTVEPGTPGTN